MTAFRIDQINTAYFNGLVVGRNAPGGLKLTFQTANGDTVDNLAGQIAELSAQVAALRAQVAALCAQVAALCAQVDALCGFRSVQA